jgi:hypothetical protein
MNLSKSLSTSANTIWTIKTHFDLDADQFEALIVFLAAITIFLLAFISGG